MDDLKDKLLVIDASCTSEYPERKHEIIYNGEILPVTFKYGEKKYLPIGIAQKLNLPESGFTVCDPVTEEPIEQPVKETDVDRFRLKPDQTIARYKELTLEALRSRVVIVNGGERFVNASAEEIINFFTERNGLERKPEEDDLIDDFDFDDDGIVGGLDEVEENQEPAPAPAPNQAPKANTPPQKPEQEATGKNLDLLVEVQKILPTGYTVEKFGESGDGRGLYQLQDSTGKAEKEGTLSGIRDHIIASQKLAEDQAKAVAVATEALKTETPKPEAAPDEKPAAPVETKKE